MKNSFIPMLAMLLASCCSIGEASNQTSYIGPSSTWNQYLSITNSPAMSTTSSPTSITTGDANTKGLVIQGTTNSPNSVPAGVVFDAEFITDGTANASYVAAGGSATATTTGATIHDHLLDMSGGTLKYVTYTATNTAKAALNVGTIRFILTPGNTFSGTQVFVTMGQTTGDHSTIQVYQNNGGQLCDYIADNTQTQIDNTCVSWSPVAGVPTELELDYDFNSGDAGHAITLFQDGVAAFTGNSTGVRSASDITNIIVGKNNTSDTNADFSMTNIVLYTTVQHTANYTAPTAALGLVSIPQSAHLLEFKNSGGTVLSYFDKAGAFSGNAATATALATQPPVQNTLYADTINGSDSNNCSQLYPCATIGKLATVTGSAADSTAFAVAATAAYRWIIAPGTYTEAVSIPTRQLISIDMTGVKIVGNMTWALTSAAAGTLNRPQLILNGSSLRPVYNDTNHPITGVVGNISMTTSGSGFPELMLIMTGATGTVNYVGTGATEVFCSDCVIAGGVTTSGGGQTTLDAENSLFTSSYTIGGTSGLVILSKLSNILFSGLVVTTASQNGVSWTNVRFKSGANDFTSGTGAVNADAVTMASWAANVPTKGSVTMTRLDDAVSANTVSTPVLRDSSGNFSAGTITASLTGTASLNMPLAGGTFTGQFLTSYGTPTIANNACGSTTQGTVSGHNQAGKITVGTVNVTACTVSFSATLGTAPDACELTAANTTAAAQGTALAYVSSVSTTNFVITGVALAGAAYYYHCY